MQFCEYMHEEMAFFPLFFLPMLKVERKVYFSEAFQLLGGPEVLKMLSLIFITYV